MLTEKLLHFIWRYRLFDTSTLVTREGEAITILNTGKLNQHAGPDFLEAKIRIGHTLWVGHIELHILSSDWNRHGHEVDPLYEKLILHVVYQYDTAFRTRNNTTIPVLELSSRIKDSLLAQYHRLLNEPSGIPCSTFLASITGIHVQNQLDRMMAERLEEQVSQIQRMNVACGNDFEEVCYRRLAKCFGIHINQDAFEELAHVLPYRILRKYRSDLFQLEALLFGSAGMLTGDFEQDYPLELKREFNYLQRKHGLTTLAPERWKFLRLRPSNFPPIRISQLAAILHRNENLHSMILHSESLKNYESVFRVEASNYWRTHYSFKHAGPEKRKIIGQAFFHSLMINSVIPLLFYYSNYHSNSHYKSMALKLLDELPFEKNTVTDDLVQMGFSGRNARDSQSLIQLKKYYCEQKKCLECSIGYQVLKGEGSRL